MSVRNGKYRRYVYMQKETPDSLEYQDFDRIDDTNNSSDIIDEDGVEQEE